MPREVELRVGYGSALSVQTRGIPDDEPRPWDAAARLRVVGKPVPRVDARAKVTGQAVYTRDVRLPDMLYGAVVRSPYPAAAIESVDTAAAERLPGVRAVHVLDRSRVRYQGHEVAAVAADTPHQAEDAAAAVRVDYRPGPFVVSFEAALRPDAPVVMPGGGNGRKSAPQQNGNVFGPATRSLFGANRGDVPHAVQIADAVVEQEFSTPVQTHSCLETHAAVADWDAAGRLVVHCGTKSVTKARAELADYFDLPYTRVRVVNSFVGGHFGTKGSSLPYAALAAHLAKKAGRPVKIVLSRKDEHLTGGNRPQNRMQVRVAGMRDGTLAGVELTNYGSAGAGFGGGASGPFYSIYDCAHVRAADYDVLMNTGPACAFRAPGHPQGAFALEVAIDMLCLKLGQDPVAFRLRNSGARTNYGSARNGSAGSTAAIPCRAPRTGRSSAASAWPTACGTACTLPARRWKSNSTGTAAWSR